MTENLFETGKYEFQVHAVVAMLDEVHTARVKELWSLLDVTCGLRAINATPFPHFSFHIAGRYDIDRLEERLAVIAMRLPRFTVRTTGLSIFTGSAPVVFVPLVVDQQLLSIHQTIWDETSVLAERLSSHYRPGHWVPHITLANKDVTAENLGCVAQQLSTRSFVWEIEISHLGIVCQEEGVAKIHRTFALEMR